MQGSMVHSKCDEMVKEGKRSKRRQSASPPVAGASDCRLYTPLRSGPYSLPPDAMHTTNRDAEFIECIHAEAVMSDLSALDGLDSLDQVEWLPAVHLDLVRVAERPSLPLEEISRPHDPKTLGMDGQILVEVRLGVVVDGRLLSVDLCEGIDELLTRDPVLDSGLGRSCQRGRVGSSNLGQRSSKVLDRAIVSDASGQAVWRILTSMAAHS